MTPIPNKPLRLPASAPSVEARRTVNERLRGHSKSPAWLPEGLWPELDEIRAEQLRVLGQVATELEALETLTARFRAEDDQYERALRQAQRDGTAGQLQDRRVPSEERHAQLVEGRRTFWAAAVVMAEKADAVVELVREREDEWLGDLRSRLGPAEEKRREMQRLEAEAKAEEWQLHKLGDWLQKLSDDGPFGREPAPTPTAPPAEFSAERFQSMLNRPWHKREEAEELPRAWSEQDEDDVEPLDTEDDTGVVSELDPEPTA